MRVISSTRWGALLVGLTLLAGCAGAALAQNAQEDSRRDQGFSTSESLQSGRDAEGNVVMSITKPQKEQQQAPPIGPIYVVPQVNPQGGGPLMPGPGVRPGQRGYPAQQARPQ